MTAPGRLYPKTGNPVAHEYPLLATGKSCDGGIIVLGGLTCPGSSMETLTQGYTRTIQDKDETRQIQATGQIRHYYRRCRTASFDTSVRLTLKELVGYFI